MKFLLLLLLVGCGSKEGEDQARYFARTDKAQLFCKDAGNYFTSGRLEYYGGCVRGYMRNCSVTSCSAIQER